MYVLGKITWKQNTTLRGELLKIVSSKTNQNEYYSKFGLTEISA